MNVLITVVTMMACLAPSCINSVLDDTYGSVNMHGKKECQEMFNYPYPKVSCQAARDDEIVEYKCVSLQASDLPTGYSLLLTKIT